MLYNMMQYQTTALVNILNLKRCTEEHNIITKPCFSDYHGVKSNLLYQAKKATASIARGPKCGNNNHCAHSLLFKSFTEQGVREWYYSGTEGDPAACPSSPPVWLADCELLREMGRIAPLDSALPQEGATQGEVNTCSTCWGSWEDPAIKRT